jgi:DNA-binding CsgD family transcriptional regulator
LINEKIEKTNFQNKLLIDALNLINSPLLVVDKDATIRLSNTLAEQMFRKLPFLNIKNNKVHASRPALNNQLLCIIQQAITLSGTLNIPQSNALQYYDPETQKTIRFLVTPINHDRVNLTNQKKPLAMLIIDCEENSQDLSSRYLRDLYGLTQAEALLTAELCQGNSLEEIANKRTVTRNTLKTQLHATFHKTGVDRQSALVALIKNGLSGKFRVT